MKVEHISLEARLLVSSVRRILKRGAKNFRKFGKNKDLNQKLFLLNLVRFFAQNQVKSKKKKSLHSNLIQFFAKIRCRAKKRSSINLVRFLAQSLEETHRTCPLCDQTLSPTCKGHAMQRPCKVIKP